MKGRKLKYMLLMLTTAMVFVSAPVAVHAAVPGWEYTSQSTVDLPAAEAIGAALSDVSVRDGYIYVTVTRPVSVRVINILGQTVSTQTLSRGTSRLRIATRGVYIVRAENISRRVTV